VFLVDDNKPEFGHRRKHGRAGTDDELRGSVASSSPRDKPLDIGQARVQNGGIDAQAIPEPRDELRRQPDLGYENEHLPAGSNDVGHDAQVNLGLAAAGDAVEQERGETGLLANGVDGLLLAPAPLLSGGR
jgi:hypothetical protein